MRSIKSSQLSSMSNSNLMYSKMGMLFSITALVVIIAVLFFRKTELFDSKPTLTYYYMSGCGWCKKFMPAWEAFEQDAPEGVVVRKVNANDAAEEIKQFSITGFPHIQMVKGDEVKVFNSERTKDALRKFVQDNL